MILEHIRKGKAFRIIALILSINFLTFQNISLAGDTIREERISYRPETRGPLTDDSPQFSSEPENLSNPNDEDSPLSPASEGESEIGTSSSVILITGSISFSNGNYTNQTTVTLALNASGGRNRADGNQDGTVDTADYAVWRNNRGTSGPQGDYDGSGLVDQDDYTFWRSQFGSSNGVTEMAFSSNGVDYSPWEQFQTTKAWVLSNGEGQKNIYVKFRDFFGNESQSFVNSINLDTTAPKGSIILNNGSTLTSSQSVSLALQASDGILRGDGNGDGSVDAADFALWRNNLGATGVNPADYDGNGIVDDADRLVWRAQFGKAKALPEMRFSTDDGTNWTEWVKFSSTHTLELPIGDGLKGVRYQIRDEAGNVSQDYVASITLDQTLPTVFLQSSPYVFDSHYELHYKASDLHMNDIEKNELVELKRGWNEIKRQVTDDAGNIREIAWKVFLDQNAERGTFFDYDANGNITNERTPSGDEIKYEYDANNQLIKILYPDGSFIRYTYDGMGKRTSMQDKTGMTFYIYDEANRLRRLIQPTGELIDYTYDHAGNLIQMIYAGKTIDYTYDAANRLKTVTDENGTTTYTYNEAGDLIEKRLPNGIVTTYDYDEAGRLKGITHAKEEDGVLTVVSSIHYDLNSAGERISARIFDANAERSHRLLEYDYDLFGRLIEERDFDYSDQGNQLKTKTIYTYDAAGNRLTKEVIQSGTITPRILTKYTYGIDNRLEILTTEKYDEMNNLVSSETETFVYDAVGNLRQRITPNKTIYYEYDFENRLVAWFDGEKYTEFIYDGDGNRIGKRVNGETTYYVIDPNREISQVLAELDSDGNVTETYTYGLDRIGASGKGQESSYFLQDGLGSTTNLANSTGSITESYSYDAFGNPRVPIHDSQTTFLYTGEQLDSETSLIYLRNRYYDPNLGRFISRDPIIGKLDETQSFNPYPYVQNNPANFVDPLGLSPNDEEWWRRLPHWHYGNCGGYNRDCATNGLHGTNALDKLFETHDKAMRAAHTPAERAQADEELARGLRSDLGQLPFSGKIYKELSKSVFKEKENNKHGSNPPGGGGGLYGGYSGSLDNSYNSFKRSSDWWNKTLSGDYSTGSRGGVLLDKALSVSGLAINDIQGVTFDPYTGQVVLLGEAGGAVPEIEMDYLITALKAVFGSVQDPGVTIDPVTNPDGTNNWSQDQLVRHFGGIEDTTLGWVVYEADRLMKSISHGLDNITHAELTQDNQNISQSFIRSQEGLSDFLNMFTRWQSVDGARQSRFWFVPKEMKLVRSEGQDTFVFDNNSVQLLTEDLLIGNGAEDPDAKAFAAFFTQHYDKFAEIYPIFEELKKAARAVAFAKFIKDSNVPVDLNWLSNAPLPVVSTPRTTPVGQNSVSWNTEVRNRDGSITTTTHTHTIRGGVTVDFINGLNFNYLSDVLNEASILGVDSTNSRPDDLATTWNFNSGGTQYDATALSFAPTRKDANFYWQESDLSFDTAGEFDLEWNRYFDSFDSSGTRLGFGWFFNPYTIESTETSRPYLINNQTRWLFPKIRYKDRSGQLTEDMVLSYLLDDGTLVYVPDGKQTSSSLHVHPDNTFTFQYSDRRKVYFLADGTLDYLEDQNGNRINYIYDDGRLKSIQDPVSGKQIELVYDNLGRLSQVNGPENKTLTYTYDSVTGDLKTKHESWTNRTITYSYDQGHRLTSAVDHTGKVLFINIYDEIGRLKTHVDKNGNLTEIDPNLLTHQTVSRDPINGAQLKQTYDASFRLTGTQDALGNQTSFVYGGLYGPTSMIDPRGFATNFIYDSMGNERLRTDALNHDFLSLHQTNAFGDTRLMFSGYGTNNYGPLWGDAFTYGDTGNLKSMMEGSFAYLDDEGNIQYQQTPFITQFGYDENGNLNSVTNANFHTTGYKYDSAGNLTKITDALNKSTELTYETVEIPSDQVLTGNGDVHSDQVTSKFGGSSARFDGSGDYLSLTNSEDFNFGTGDFTIDTWVKFDSGNGLVSLFSKFQDPNNKIQLTVSPNANKIALDFRTSTVIERDWSPSINTWYHVALVRSGNSISIFIDGSKLGESAIFSGDLDAVSADVKIGSRNSDLEFKGWLDEYRISKGVARWTSNFNPPTEEHILDQNSSLLLHFNETNSSNQFIYSKFDPQISNRIASVKDPLNRTVQFGYDTAENLTRVSTAFSETNYDYDSRDRMQSITDPMDRTTQFEYRDSIDKIVETRELGDIDNPLDDLIAIFDYDRFGNMTSLAGPLGGATSFAYDILNRLTRIIAPQTTPLAGVDSITIQNATANSTQIQLEVTKPLARAILRYHVDGETAYKTFVQEGPITGLLNFQLEGLESGTNYIFDLEMIDHEGRQSFTRERSFTTLGDPLLQENMVEPKSLYGQVYNVAATSVTFGLFDFDLEVVNPSLVKGFNITLTPIDGGTPVVKTFENPYTYVSELTGLNPNTEYNYTFEVTPFDSAPFDPPKPIIGSFKTANPLDQIRPVVIDDFITSSVDSAVLHLETNEPLLNVEVGVYNWETKEVEFKHFFPEAGQKDFLITGLKPSTLYAYWYRLTDFSGNELAPQYMNFTFTSGFDHESLVLENRVSNRNPESALIEVFTDENVSQLKVQYRTKGESNWSEKSVNPKDLKIQISLSGLSNGVEYEYRIDVTDSSGNRSIGEIKPLSKTEENSIMRENANGIFELSLDGNILDSAKEYGSVDSETGEGWAVELSRKFLEIMEDGYDFLIVVPSLAAGKRLSLETKDSISDVSNGSFFFGAQNHVNGIGRGHYDFRELFGSSESGELEGLVFLDSGLNNGDNFRFASSDFTDERNLNLWNKVLAEELAHRFGSFLTSEDGNPYGLLGRALAHWGAFFDADFSPMDGNDWVDNGDGTFTLAKSYLDEWALARTNEPSVYNDLDLYSMGLLDAKDVKPTFVIENPRFSDGRKLRLSRDGEGNVEVENPDGSWSTTFLLTDTVIQGTRKEITLQDIINLEGERTPPFPNAQDEFKTAFIVLTNEEESWLDKMEMSNKLARFKDSFTDFFNDMTRGVASLIFPEGETLNNALLAGQVGQAAAAFINNSNPSAPFSPLYSHSAGGYNRIQPNSIDRVLLESVVDHPSLIDFDLDKISTTLTSANLNGINFTSIPQLGSLIPANIKDLISNTNPEFAEKPILYSEWKETQGIQTTPFEIDSIIGTSLPMLVSSERLVRQRTDPPSVWRKLPIEKVKPHPELLQSTDKKRRNKDFAPLGWSAVESRLINRKKKSENESTQKLKGIKFKDEPI